VRERCSVVALLVVTWGSLFSLAFVAALVSITSCGVLITR
jgi:hypothetical protein